MADGAIVLTEDRINRYIRENQDRDVRDKQERGLVLRLRATMKSEASGSWSVQYRRRADGVMRRLTIGTYTNPASRRGTRLALTLAKAREEAVRLRSEISTGFDPVETKAERLRVENERQAVLADEMTVAEMLELWFVSKKMLRSIDADRSLFKVDVLAPRNEPAPLGAMRLSMVRKRDIARAVDRAILRGSPVTATRLLRRMSTAFKWAVSRGYIAANPCLNIDLPTSYRERSRDRVLDTQELRAFLVTLPNSSLCLAHQRILHLELLTGQRIGEICGMHKMELNLVDCIWSIPGKRTKNGKDHLVPIPPLARTIIMAALGDAGASAFVFPILDGKQSVDPNVVSHALERVQYLPPPVKNAPPRSKHARKNPPEKVAFGFMHPQTGEPHPFTSHDLRRTLATQVEKLGVPLRVISKLLNHTESKSVTDAIYARADLLPERYEALVRWERALRDIMDGRDPFGLSVASFRDIDARILGTAAKQIEGTS